MSGVMRMRVRDFSATILVSAFAGAFGVALIEGSSVLATTLVEGNLGQVASARLMLSMVSTVFLVIALYVAAIVTANTVGTVIAGRLREIALLRLIGAPSGSLRRSVATEGLVCALIGALIGAVVATALVYGGVAWAVAARALPNYPYTVLVPEVVLPILATIGVGWAASWSGSKRVLSVSPISAVAAQVDDLEPRIARTRVVVGSIVAVLGFGILALGTALGLVSPGGILIAVFGGVVSFTGIIVLSPVLMPALLRLAGTVSGSAPAARIATLNGVRYPARSTRSMIGVVIAVALVTMFAVAGSTFSSMMERVLVDQPGAVQDEMNGFIGGAMTIFGVLFGFSALIAAAGLVNNLTLSVLQRHRELGLLRTLGFQAKQIRSMIVIEAVQMSLVAVVFGLVLGTVYGWSGAQALVGTISHEVMPPTIPALLVLGAVVFALVLAVAASLLASRRATRVSPVDALAIA